MLVLCGCAGPSLPTTPNLYGQGDSAAMEDTPADRRTVEVELLYATDRMPVEGDDAQLKGYDERRSHSLALGRATIRMGDELSWEELLQESLDPKGRRVPLDVVSVEELVRFPSSIWLPIWTDGELQEDPQMRAALDAAEGAAREELRRRLASSARKEIFIYIHGVGNSFEDPLYRMAELWHFLGRPGIPVVYTWPAKKGGGPLRSYTYARESSEFTVYHLRQFLEVAASCPEVQRIHILSHSRGTGVSLAVLRDLSLIHKDDPAAGRQRMKLGQVILAAPDIDLRVSDQLFYPDAVYEIFDRMTIYLTFEDEALGLSDFLFSGGSRVGSATVEGLSPEEVEGLKSDRLGHDTIDVKVKDKGAHKHSYWIDNPAVLSDVILVLRDARPPGREHGRPLIRAESGLWELYDGYPHHGRHAESGR